MDKTLTDWPCPVCGSRTWHTSDRIEGTECESDEWCDCGAWRSEFRYGGTAEWIGPHEITGSWTDGEMEEADRTRLRIRARDECRRIDKGLALACHDSPEDAGVRLILADWCQERGLDEWAAFWRSEAETIRRAAT